MKKLNFCVRHGNRCILLAIATTLMRTLRSQNWLSLLLLALPMTRICSSKRAPSRRNLRIRTLTAMAKERPSRSGPLMLRFLIATARALTWLSPRPISTGPLHASLHFHFQPIYLIIFQGSYFHIGMGNLISRGASHLDAFSVYPFRS